MGQRIAFVGFVVAVVLMACDGGSGTTSPTTSDDRAPWTYFEVEIDTAVVVDLSDGDWSEPPVNATQFLGEVVSGRRAGEVIQWQVRFDTPPELSDGRRVDAMWVSTRFVGDELAFLQEAEFSDSLHAVAQGEVGAWRARVWRSDQDG